MRILLVNEGNLERVGICMFIHQWTQAIKDTIPDGRVTIYFRQSIKDQNLGDCFKSNGVTIAAGNHSPAGLANKENREGIITDLRKIFKDNYDVVHINSSVIGFTSLVLREAKRAKIPIRISHAHGKFNESAASRILHNILRAYIRKNASVYAGCSDQAGTYLFGSKGVGGSKWIKVPNAIQTDKFRFNEEVRGRRRNEIGITEGVCLLGAVGYLEEVKNHTFLIDVMMELKEKQHPAKLIILGEGSLRNTLQDKIRAAGLGEDVILYGVSEDIPGWLSAMDCFLMPSLSEGLPISAIEAQASGLPCIFSDMVTRETDVLPEVMHLPLRAQKWMEAICELTPSRGREDALDMVKASGFDTMSFRQYIRKLYQLGRI